MPVAFRPLQRTQGKSRRLSTHVTWIGNFDPPLFRRVENQVQCTRKKWQPAVRFRRV